VSQYLLAVGMLLLCALISNAQSSSTLIGGRAAGLAYSSSCLEDEWSIFNNIGGLAAVESTTVSFTYDSQPSFKPFNRMAAILALPLKFGVAGAGVFRFGDRLYSEQILALGFSNKFGLASLGLKVNYIQYKAEGFGSKGVLTISFGGIAKLTEKISVGAHVININQPNLSTLEREKISTILIVGSTVKLSSEMFITTELEKDLSYPVKWKSGFEYQLYKKFIARTGVQVNPTSAFFGFGFRPKKFKLDYAYQHNFTLGARHQATVGYVFITKK